MGYTGIRTSNSPSYDKIFATTSGVVIPPHRGLLINCTVSGSITITNLDQTTTTLTLVAPERFFLPVQINKWTTVSGTHLIHAVL